MTPKPEMPKPEKYDEVASLIYFDDDGNGRTSPERIAAILRRAFPSAPSDTESAEDAQEAEVQAYLTRKRDEKIFQEWRLDRFRREVDAYGRAHGLDTILGDVDAALEAEKEDDRG